MNESAAGILLASAVVGNLALGHLIGICPALAASRRSDLAGALALAFVVCGPLAVLPAWLIDQMAGGSELTRFAQLPLYVLAVLAVVHGGGSLLRRWGHPAVAALAGPCLPLLAVSCVVLGLVLIVLTEPAPMAVVLWRALGLAAGYGLLLVLAASLAERLALASPPAALRGQPLLLISLALVAMALAGFGGGP